ncbi:hypothetical protein ABVB69_00860 [Streptomyces sp. NPDC000349]|uniref:hypothetical protein n=1 Tax=unclassified Streptomyces TaxID=2593676 RepID=UPI0027839B95|nr:hypothetical protein [Streptomyces sp. DSM 40167]MDQ0404005.1 hypothetical protein [Streptomyces sp. DSM 40167]
MRLFTPTSPRPVAAAALLAACAAASAVLVPAVPAHAESPDPLPACTAPDDHTFPLTTRVHGGPDRYEPGGGFGVWYLDLTNTTSRTCSGVHPVVVLVDKEGALEPSQPQLEFYDGADPRPVGFEKTDRDELIGAFGEGEGENGVDEGDGAATDRFAGFTVAAGKTLTVKLRLSLTSDTAPGEVTANAAVVQRRGGDGEWIGQSNDYRFRIGSGTPAEASPDASPDRSATPEDRSTGTPSADELAGTGPGRVETALAVTLLFFAAGGTAVLLTRGRRR